jgi:hypothetical protein
MNVLILRHDDPDLRFGGYGMEGKSFFDSSGNMIYLEFLFKSNLGRQIQQWWKNALRAASSDYPASCYKFELLLSHYEGETVFVGCFISMIASPAHLGRRTIGCCRINFDKVASQIEERVRGPGT